MRTSFAGMAHTDGMPLRVDDRDVTPAHMLEIPVPLRDHAVSFLDTAEAGQWWTVGEFRYAGDTEYDTAVARRVMRDGRLAVQYGVEGY